jgi:hypothetical protein
MVILLLMRGCTKLLFISQILKEEEEEIGMLSDQKSRGYKTSVDCLPTANTLR